MITTSLFPVHRRQFVLGPRAVHPVRGWLAEEAGGCVLSHCPELRVRRHSDKAGQSWVLIGNVVQGDSSRPAPDAEIPRTATLDVPLLCRTWTGRWVLIGSDTLRADASALLGCFWAIERKDGDEFLWVSSSPALLPDQCYSQPPRSIRHARGMDWYPPPRARQPALRRLLPSQVLRLSAAAIQAKPGFLDIGNRSYDEQLDTFQDHLVTCLKNVAGCNRRLLLPLTAGRDSRLILAAALHAGIEVTTYTQVYPFMSRSDYDFPPALARIAGVEHFYARPAGHDRTLAAVFDSHTAGHCVDQDRFFYSQRQFEWCNDGDVILRSPGMELGCPRAPARPRFAGDEFTPAIPDAPVIIAGYGDVPIPPLVNALQDWRHWCEITSNPAVDWRDRFYIEQRLGGWASDIEQGLDLIDAERFPIASSERFFSATLAVAWEKRRDSIHQRDLIQRMMPSLLNFPFNPPESGTRMFMKRIHQRLEALRSTFAQSA